MNPAILDSALEGSFRDPDGVVFRHEGKLYRAIFETGRGDYDLLMSSGLYDKLLDMNCIIAHSEVQDLEADLPAECTVIRPEEIPFFSYPYEWCFSQLRDAALLTLKIQRTALDYGMCLKDASSFNITFKGSQPAFIDTLSFTRLEDEKPWAGYRQFCEHFLAPLLLMRYGNTSLNRLLRIWTDGVPLETAARLLPWYAKLLPGVFLHVVLHARGIRRGDKKNAAEKPVRQSLRNTRALLDHLERIVSSLKLPSGASDWSEYYEDTLYEDEEEKLKKETIAGWIQTLGPRQVWDFGSNTGKYGRLAAARDIYTVAFERDEVVVDRAYGEARSRSDSFFCPLVMDMTNPSPSLGWAHQERTSLAGRGPVDLVLYLALVHHITLHGHVPLAHQAEYLAGVAETVIIEWISPEDANVLRMTTHSATALQRYNEKIFHDSFERFFNIESRIELGASGRCLYKLKRK